MTKESTSLPDLPPTDATGHTTPARGLISAVIIAVCTFLILRVPVEWVAPRGLPRDLSLLAIRGMHASLGFALVVFVTTRVARLRPSDVGLVSGRANLGAMLGRFGLGAVLGLFGVIIAFCIAWGKGAFIAFPAMPDEWPTARVWLIEGLSLLLAATFEEFCFRTGLVAILSRAVPEGIAIAMPAALFGLAHGQNPGVSALAVLNTTLAGVLFGMMLRDRFRSSLGLTIGFHWAWNFTMGPLLGIPVSGHVARSHYLSVEPTDIVWSGGSYGIEGGLAALIVLVVLTAAWAFKLHRRQESRA
jgi:membrane protease YdiL (CAAX protease family)